MEHHYGAFFLSMFVILVLFSLTFIETDSTGNLITGNVVQENNVEYNNKQTIIENHTVKDITSNAEILQTTNNDTIITQRTKIRGIKIIQ
jgi:hypothetical protein